jgi:hypothetical protein
MAKVAPTSKVLYEEMKKAGFEEFIKYIPDGDAFWRFLKGVAKDGTCISCKDGSGDPGCAVRICAKEKGVEMCAFCDSYPCEKFNPFFEGYPILKTDNLLLRDKGWDAWGELQDERVENGFTYQNER